MPEDHTARELARGAVHGALARMPAEQRLLLRRRHLHGAGRREIAAALGITVSQYEKLHAVAWSALRHLLAADQESLAVA